MIDNEFFAPAPKKSTTEPMKSELFQDKRSYAFSFKIKIKKN